MQADSPKTKRAKLTLLYLASLQAFRRGELSLEEDQVLLRLRTFLAIPANHVRRLVDAAFKQAAAAPAPDAQTLTVPLLLRIARRQAKLGGRAAAEWRRSLPALERHLRSPQDVPGSFFTDLNQAGAVDAPAPPSARRRPFAPQFALACGLLLIVSGLFGTAAAPEPPAAKRFAARVDAAEQAAEARDFDDAIAWYEKAELAAWGLQPGEAQARALHKAHLARTQALISKAAAEKRDLSSAILTGFEDALQALGDSDRFWKQRSWTRKQRQAWYRRHPGLTPA